MSRHPIFYPPSAAQPAPLSSSPAPQSGPELKLQPSLSSPQIIVVPPIPPLSVQPSSDQAWKQLRVLGCDAVATGRIHPLLQQLFISNSKKREVKATLQSFNSFAMLPLQARVRYIRSALRSAEMRARAQSQRVGSLSSGNGSGKILIDEDNTAASQQTEAAPSSSLSSASLATPSPSMFLSSPRSTLPFSEPPMSQSIEVKSINSQAEKALNTVLDHVTCPICTLVLYRAQKFACDHSACLPCIQQWVSVRGRNTKCHVCNYATGGRYGPHFLLQSLAMEGFPEKYQESKRFHERNVLQDSVDQLPDAARSNFEIISRRFPVSYVCKVVKTLGEWLSSMNEHSAGTVDARRRLESLTEMLHLHEPSYNLSVTILPCLGRIPKSGQLASSNTGPHIIAAISTYFIVIQKLNHGIGDSNEPDTAYDPYGAALTTGNMLQ